jgi:hypothetical protein
MKYRAAPSGVTLGDDDAALVKGMLERGDRQHDIAAWFGVNGGRIGEIAAGRRFRAVAPAARSELPPPGPYPSGRQAAAFIQALTLAREALDQAEAFIKRRD